MTRIGYPSLLIHATRSGLGCLRVRMMKTTSVETRDAAVAAARIRICLLGLIEYAA